MLATAAGAVVMLSVMLLLGYLGRMIDEQEKLELEAQAALSAESASDWLEQNLADRAGSIEALDGSCLEIAGLETRIDLLGSSSVPPATFTIGHTTDCDCSLIASNGGVALLRRDGETISADLIELDSGDSTRLSIGVSTSEGGWTALGTGPCSGFLCALITDTGATDIHFVTMDGDVTSIHSDIPRSDWLLAEAGLLDGLPAVILYSDSGPSAAILSTGSVLLGEGAMEAAFGLGCEGSPVSSTEEDLLRSDLDMDGLMDFALIGSESVIAFLSSGPHPTDSIPGMRPEAWGLSDRSNSLLICWGGPSGRIWRRLGWSGFQDFMPAASLSSIDWEGRFSEGSDAISGNSGGLVTAGGYSGSLERISGETPVFTNIDGGPPDALLHEKNGWTVVLNPLRGEGTGTSWRLSTGSGVSPMRTDTLRFSTFIEETGTLSVRREEA